MKEREIERNDWLQAAIEMQNKHPVLSSFLSIHLYGRMFFDLDRTLVPNTLLSMKAKKNH